jgi:WD40 repeat protein
MKKLVRLLILGVFLIGLAPTHAQESPSGWELLFQFQMAGHYENGYFYPVRSVSWHPDGQRILAYSLEDNGARAYRVDRVYNAHSGEILLELGNHGNFQWSPDGQSIVRLDQATRQIRFYDSQTGTLIRIIPVGKVRLQSDGIAWYPVKISWSPDGSMLAVTTRQTVLLWTIQGNFLGTIYYPDDIVAVKWSPDSQYLSIEARHSIFLPIFRVSDLGKPVLVLYNSHNLTWQSNSKIFGVISDLNKIRIWNIETGELLQTLNNGEAFFNSLVWHPNGNFLATFSGDQGYGTTAVRNKIWDWETGEMLVEILPQDIGMGYGWTEDLHYYWALDASSFRLFTPDGQNILFEQKHFPMVIQFSPNGKWLADYNPAGNEPFGLRIWDMETLTVVAQFDEITYNLMAWSPNNQAAYVEGQNGEIYVYGKRQ